MEEKESFVIGKREYLGYWIQIKYENLDCWLFKVFGIRIDFMRTLKSDTESIFPEDSLTDENGNFIGFRSLEKEKYTPISYFSNLKPPKNKY